MNRLSDHKLVVEAFFQERLEEVQAGELVTVLGTKKPSKLQLLILCRSLAASGSLANHTWTLNLVSIGKNNSPKIKQAFAADRLRDVTHNGSFDATFNFGASGMLSVSFGSQIQRDMFLATLKRFNEMKSRKTRNDGLLNGQEGVNLVHGVLSPVFGLEVDADAVSRVRKLYQEKRRVFSTKEEQHLLKFVREGDFDDIKGFQEELFSSQKRAELAALNTLVTSVNSWDDMRNQVINLIHHVENLEGCIEQFSSNLLSKKGVIEEIEHTNNALLCRQQNLAQLHVIMTELHDQLSLKPAAQVLLRRLQREPDSNLIAFFSEDGNAETLSDAMKHMQQILHNPQLDSDYPIAAVGERKAYFLEQRRMVVQRSRSYIFSIIDGYEKQYIADRARYSGDDRLVWRLHTDLSEKLLKINDIIQALSRIDMEGFASTLRKYRTGMQKVYHVEIYKYFKGLHKQIKKVNPSSGPFLLGSSENKAGGITISMEPRQVGGTPPMWRSTPLPSPALTPRGASGYDGANSSLGASSETGNGSRERVLYIEFPSSTVLNGMVLYPNCTIHRDSNTRTGLSCVIHCPHKLLRPDLTFSIALESTVACILYEESILNNCFGITEANLSASDAAASARVESTKTSFVHSSSSSFSAFESNMPIFDGLPKDEARAPGRQQEDADLFIESLVEVFGTDIARIRMEPPATPREDVSLISGGRKLSVRSELGLPPRYPPSPSIRSMNDSLSYHGHPRETDSATPHGSRASDTATHQVLTPQIAHRIRSCFLATELISFSKFFADKCDRIYSIVALCVIKAYLRNPSKLMAKSTFCQCLLRDLEKIVRGAIMRFVAEQTESINVCRRRYVIRPTALLHCFKKMPALILRMEEIHNSLSEEVRDRTQYASIMTSLVDQSFDALDAVTALKSAGGSSSEDSKLNLVELLEKKVHDVIERLNSDENKALKRNFIQQYRHHAFFCAFYVALPTGSYAVELLHEHYESSKVKRNFYRDLYMTRVLLAKDFPNFGVFILSAEDLSNVYSEEELRHHRTLSVDAVKKVLDKFEKEFRTGVRSSATRIKKHFLREVVSGGNEESFHSTLLQRTWQQFSKLILRKYDFFTNLLAKPNYCGLKVPVTRDEVAKLLSSF